jgi:hypothetical protein
MQPSKLKIINARKNTVAIDSTPKIFGIVGCNYVTFSFDTM